MKDLDLQVSDRVTYKYTDKSNTVVELVSNDNVDVLSFKDYLENERIKILKIERIGENGWYTVYEKKDLLTSEEKEFLKDIIKYYDNISQIKFREEIINLCDEDSYVMCSLDYPDNMKFENIKKVEFYTLKDLGLEEEV